jgi:hypothetical protein
MFNQELIKQQKISLLDPLASFKFDLVIKFYCDFLYKWGMFNKRIELFEYVTDKPKEIDEKFGNSSFFRILHNSII